MHLIMTFFHWIIWRRWNCAIIRHKVLMIPIFLEESTGIGKVRHKIIMIIHLTTISTRQLILFFLWYPLLILGLVAIDSIYSVNFNSLPLHSFTIFVMIRLIIFVRINILSSIIDVFQRTFLALEKLSWIVSRSKHTCSYTVLPLIIIYFGVWFEITKLITKFLGDFFTLKPLSLEVPVPAVTLIYCKSEFIKIIPFFLLAWQEFCWNFNDFLVVSRIPVVSRKNREGFTFF